MDQFTFVMLATVCNNWKLEFELETNQKIVIETEWLLYHKKLYCFLFLYDANFIENGEENEEEIGINDL